MIPILEWKWECITIYFVVGFPFTFVKFDNIWVTMDRLTKSAQLLKIQTMNNSEKIDEIKFRMTFFCMGFIFYNFRSWNTISIISCGLCRRI